jgi:predicted acyl esterase
VARRLPSVVMAALCAGAMVGAVVGAVSPPPATAVEPSPASLTAAGSGTARNLTAQGSVEQVAVTGATPKSMLRLADPTGTMIARRRADAAGALLFRDVPPGNGYVVSEGEERSAAVTVTAASDVPPNTLFASQSIADGYGYFRTRDGTLLSINVTLPGPVDEGPYPTVVEYSGYDPSNPDGRPPAASIARIFGFATVGVNLRGTGCSGGAFDYFEPLQSLDGYDVIETIAAQPWVAHGSVGMVGISYPGITQLFVAATRPPHLAAITPLSVIDDTSTTLLPGGIFNDGFALRWAKDRQADARPLASKWARARVAKGDDTCKANQALRLQAPNVLEQLRHYRLGGTDQAARAPAPAVDQIDVPVFIAGSWQDQETGPHFAEMLDDFAPGTVVKATVMNGVHADSLSPEIIPRWLEFLDFYVARTVPTITPVQRLLATAILSDLYGDTFSIPPDRFDPDADFAAQLTAYEAEPMLRARFDVGAGEADGAPFAAFAATATAWPPPLTTVTTWYLGPDGALTDAPAATGTPDTYRYDPEAFPRTLATVRDTSGARSVASAPQFRWKELPKGKALAYDSDPLARDTVMLGTGSVDLFLSSTAPAVDLEVTISEIRPDGQETYVQSGWMRAAELPAGRSSLVRVPLEPFGHAFRAGSRVRIVVQPPGGNRPEWAFDAITYDHAVTNRVGISGTRASKVTLPVVPGIDVSTPLPACGTLRGQPCRTLSEP